MKKEEQIRMLLHPEKYTDEQLFLCLSPMRNGQGLRKREVDLPS